MQLNLKGIAVAMEICNYNPQMAFKVQRSSMSSQASAYTKDVTSNSMI